jgi:aspartate 1-decarboxylase
MQRILLKSKLHHAVITGASVDYVGSITIPSDLMLQADLWEGEQVLVASSTTGERLTTYVLTGEAGSRRIEMNGAAAKVISAGETVIIMAFAMSEKEIRPRILFMNPDNTVAGTK